MFQRQPEALKLCKVIVHLQFYNICKFESRVTRKDVIMMSLPKTMETIGNVDLGGTKQKISFERF